MAVKRSVAGTAADPTIRFAELVIDEKTYKLAYSFNAIAIAESVAGCNLLQGFLDVTNLSAKQLRGLFYAALLVAQPTITIDEAGALLRADTILEVYRAMTEAYNMSLPEQKKTQDVASDSK